MTDLIWQQLQIDKFLSLTLYSFLCLLREEQTAEYCLCHITCTDRCFDTLFWRPLSRSTFGYFSF